MMFKRLKPLPLWRKLLNFIWPEIGFKRAMQYIYLRILRIKGNPEGIARGLAFGIAISITPLIGFHLMLIGLFCWIFRGNFLAGALSSLLGNPITFPFTLYTTYMLGIMILPTTGHVDLSPIALFDMISSFVQSVWTLNLSLFATDVWPVLLPMLLGSLPLAVIAYVLIYGISLKLIERYRKERI